MADKTAVLAQTQQTLNTTGIVSTSTALASNPARGGFILQNLGQNALFVNLGASASTSVFTVVLKAATANDDGTGGSLAMEDGCVYSGIITIAGSSPRYVATEW